MGDKEIKREEFEESLYGVIENDLKALYNILSGVPKKYEVRSPYYERSIDIITGIINATKVLNSSAVARVAVKDIKYFKTDSGGVKFICGNFPDKKIQENSIYG